MTNRNSYLTNTLLTLVCTVFLASNLIAQTSGKGFRLNGVYSVSL